MTMNIFFLEVNQALVTNAIVYSQDQRQRQHSEF